jgi:hypothetical protein
VDLHGQYRRRQRSAPRGIEARRGETRSGSMRKHESPSPAAGAWLTWGRFPGRASQGTGCCIDEATTDTDISQVLWCLPGCIAGAVGCTVAINRRRRQNGAPVGRTGLALFFDRLPAQRGRKRRRSALCSPDQALAAGVRAVCIAQRCAVAFAIFT